MENVVDKVIGKYVGIETDEGGVRESCSLRQLEKEELIEYILELQKKYPDGEVFVREY